MKATVIYQSNGRINIAKLHVNDELALNDSVLAWLDQKQKDSDGEISIMFVHYEWMLLEPFTKTGLREVNTGIEI